MLVYVLLGLAGASVQAQEKPESRALDPALGQEAYQLGHVELHVGMPASGPLKEKLRGASSLACWDFVGKVGGIAFSQVAVPGESLRDSEFSVHYDASRPDGSRLVVRAGNADHSMPIADWALIPTIRYADSEFNAVVSLLGPRSTPGIHDVVYHEAFADTLLGLRLLHADLLIRDLDVAWQLPTVRGAALLGSGESAPASVDTAAVRAIEGALADRAFDSWVLTDVDRPVRLERRGDTVVLTGTPSFHFWTTQISEAELRRLADAARRRGGRTGGVPQTQPGDGCSLAVPGVGSVTAAMSARTEDLRRFNPAVWGAVESVMRYSAFFRYLKANQPRSWEVLLRATSGVVVEPAVRTPTRLLARP